MPSGPRAIWVRRCKIRKRRCQLRIAISTSDSEYKVGHWSGANRVFFPPKIQFGISWVINKQKAEIKIYIEFAFTSVSLLFFGNAHTNPQRVESQIIHTHGIKSYLFNAD